MLSFSKKEVRNIRNIQQTRSVNKKSKKPGQKAEKRKQSASRQRILERFLCTLSQEARKSKKKDQLSDKKQDFLKSKSLSGYEKFGFEKLSRSSENSAGKNQKAVYPPTKEGESKCAKSPITKP